MREAIKRERRIELAFEGRRAYDLRRWGDLVKATSRPFTGMNIKAMKKDRKNYYMRTIVTESDCKFSKFNITQRDEFLSYSSRYYRQESADRPESGLLNENREVIQEKIIQIE